MTSIGDLLGDLGDKLIQNNIKVGKHSASCVFFSPLFLPTFVASL